MADTTTFFAELSERGYRARRTRTDDRADPDRALGRGQDGAIVTIARGTVLVANTDGDADCVVRTDRATWIGQRHLSGRRNAMAAACTGTLPEGRPEPAHPLLAALSGAHGATSRRFRPLGRTSQELSDHELRPGPHP